jgi:uncharacterized protein HemY
MRNEKRHISIVCLCAETGLSMLVIMKFCLLLVRFCDYGRPHWWGRKEKKRKEKKTLKTPGML